MAKQRNEAKTKRLKVLDNLLSGAEPLSHEQIFKVYKEHGIPASLATLRNDLDDIKHVLKEAGKREMFVEGRGGMKKLYSEGDDRRTRTYCYKDKGFLALPLLLDGMTDGEYRSLVSAIEKLSNVLQNDRTYDEIRFAIQSRVESDYQKGLIIVDYEDNRKLKGREHRPLFYNSIKGKKSLQVEYETFRGKRMSFEFHPYLLKQYNERWFAFGLRVDNGELYTSVPLDRLVTSPKEIGNYTEERPVDYLDYFKERVGVSAEKKETKKKHIIIRITDKDAWGRITTKPLNGQKEVMPFEDSLGFGQISLDVFSNPELFSKILSWGEGVEIESPRHVRERMAGLLKKISGMYPEMND